MTKEQMLEQLENLKAQIKENEFYKYNDREKELKQKELENLENDISFDVGFLKLKISNDENYKLEDLDSVDRSIFKEIVDDCTIRHDENKLFIDEINQKMEKNQETTSNLKQELKLKSNKKAKFL